MKELYKFSGGILALITLAILAPSVLSAQRTLTARSNTIVDSFTHGFYESLPASYATSGTKKYPLLVFLHGQSETGDGSAASLPAVLRNGPPMQINQQINNKVNANFPDPVVVNGQSYEFIVICPQLNTWPWNVYEQIAVNDVINYAIAHYRVDTSKMYLTGLSMGGGIAWEYPGFSGPMYAKRLAGLLVVAGASSPSSYRAAEIAKEHLPVWATANSVDNTVPTSYTTDYVALLNAAGANPAPLMTIFPETGHGGWLKTYGAPNQPGVVQNGLNVYQWMLQYKRSGDNVVIDNAPASVFTVSAGPDVTITLPTSSVKITGTATVQNETVSATAWKQISGPNTASIANSGTISPTISGLIAGTYTFQVDLTSASGKTASDQMILTVNPAPVTTVFTVSAGPDLAITLPTNSAKITGAATVKGETVASCKWKQVAGPNTAAISGSGSISPTVSGLIAGTYTFEVDISSVSGKTASDQANVVVSTMATGTFIVNAGPDISITLPTNSWKIAGTCTVKSQTVASCKWKQVSGPNTAVISGSGSITPTVSSLIAGTYTFQVDVASTTGSTSSDQMTLTVKTAAAAAASAGILTDTSDAAPSLRLYPNPVQSGQQLLIEGRHIKTGFIKFTLYDINGRPVKQVVLDNRSAWFQQTIPVSGLVKGTYILTVTSGTEKIRQFKVLVE